MKARILVGDVLDRLRGLPDESVQCVVTSPPYWGLRDYGVAGQLGREKTPEEFIAKMVEVFSQVRRVLRDDGTLWLNIGDSYAGSWGNYSGQNRGNGGQREIINGSQVPNPAYDGLESYRPATSNKLGGIKPKDLVGIPWMLAFALRADGWWLRQDIIWSKPNPMPESVTDRCTKAHEYLFLMSKSSRYYYDAEAIKEPAALSSLARWDQDIENQHGSNRVPGKTNGTMKAVGGEPRSFKGSKFNQGKTALHQLDRSSDKPRVLGPKGASADEAENRSAKGAVMGRGAGWRDDPTNSPDKRNKRSVWEIATQPYSEAHFATFPEALVEPCILAGSKVGDTVLDPFCGSGTTGVVSLRYHREFIGIELNKDYAELARKRIDAESPIFNAVEVQSDIPLTASSASSSAGSIGEDPR